MGVLRINEFSGAVPVRGDRALGDQFAVVSQNTWLYGAELRGIRPPLDLASVNPTTRKVLRIPKRTVGGDPTYPTLVPPPSYLGDSYWKLFDDLDTDIVKGQLVQDSFERWYFCSPSTGLMFNTYARMVAGQADYILGVPGPDISQDATGFNAWAPTIGSISGGTAPTNTDYAYLYTWVNEFGEESAPSLPVLGSGKSDATWVINNIRVPPAHAVNVPKYTKTRLYRTTAGQSGQYFLVTELAITDNPPAAPTGTTTYSDNHVNNSDAVLSNKLQLESITWQPPPSTLKGIIAMPNGFLIGFDKNNVYMSESYHFHAWPPEYKQATETNIVGLGILGQTCVVCTEGYPSTITGVKPATCAFTKATTGEPCLSRGSIVSTPDGVLYASQNGLVLIGPNGIANVTASIITKEEWIRDYAPAYIRGCRYQNGYLALRMLPAPNPRSGFFLDPTALKVALTEMTEFDNVKNLFNDIWSGEVFLIEGTSTMAVRRYDPPTTDMWPVLWRSKEFQYPFKENFGAYAIYWDPARFASNTYGTDIIDPSTQVRFIVYANRQVVYDQTVPLNGAPVRLPSGFKSDIWQFEIRARAPVYSLHVASTMKELKSV